MNDRGQAFDLRLAALRGRGFEVDAPTGELASQEMLYIEEQAEHASRIKSMVLDLPPHRENEKQDFLTRLINPLQAASVENELRQLLRQYRPWVLLSERVRVKWSGEGRSIELTRILERLNAVDDAIVMGSPRILSMIEDVAPKRKIEEVLTEIERRDSERLQALQGMIQMLEELGWDVSCLNRGTIYERFEEADRIHSLNDVLARCQRMVQNVIRPYGDEVADGLFKSLSRAQEMLNLDALLEVEKEVSRIEDDLLNRMGTVNRRLSEWVEEGFQIPVNLPLLPGELVSWESRLPLIVEQVEAIRILQIKIERHLMQWPEYRTLAERAFGDLGALDSLDVLLEDLISKSSEAKSACNARLDKWAGYGLEVDSWLHLVESQPRGLLEELDNHQPFIDLVVPLIEKLENLDTSINGSERVEELLHGLRSSDASIHNIGEANDWLDLAISRRTRHRVFLDRARLDLATLWPANLDSNSLDLSQYEQVITELETHGVILSEQNVITTEIDSRMTHVIEGLKREIDDWRYLGWSVDGLLEMLARDPVKLGLDLPGIRTAIAAHEQRVARFSPLPWALDIELAERVLSEFRRPECLVGLDDEFQDLVLALATAEGTGGSDFEFVPFVPNSPALSIEKRLPILVPIIEQYEEVTEVATEQEMIDPVSDDNIADTNDRSEWTDAEIIEMGVDEVEPSEIVDDSVDESEHLDPEEYQEASVDADSSNLTSKPSNSLRSMLGIGTDEPWNELVSPPLDVRVQRLVRLALILEQGDSNELIERLPKIAKHLEKWTAERLSGRNASSGKGLLIDAKHLGIRLADIPGPGTAVPLDEDVYPLPDATDLQSLELAINRLERAVMLPSAMMQTPESVES
jgi:hypothetical protein